MTSKKHEKSCSACATDIFEKKEPLWKQRKVLIIVVAGLILAIGLYFELITKQHLIAQILFLIVVAVSGYDLIKKGLLSLLKRKLDMNFLITIAAIGAFLIGHGEEGAAVVLLFYIAEFLEDFAAERARKSVASLLKLAPETARIRKRGKEIIVHVRKVNIGNTLIVRPGDRIPLDGVVIKGNSSVNQAAITGESMPVTKTKKCQVFAGTINEDGYLEVRVTKKSNETTLSKIIKLVDKAQKKKSRTELFIDRFANYYTPIVIVTALLVMTVPTLVFGLPFSVWFYRGLTLLVVSCPCALAISTPISMVSGITSAAKNGVLIKGGKHIEEIRNVKAMVFDKTGTLTEGKPGVTDIIPLNQHSKQELLQIAASLESKSKHPIAEAIINTAESKGVKLKHVSKFRSIAGKGLKGRINRRSFYVGNKNFFKEHNSGSVKELISKIESEGKTVVMVGNKDHVIGLISLMDKIRDESLSTVKKLKARGIKTIMLTGDNERAARVIAKKLGIDEYHAELLPEDKVEIVKRLLKDYGHVAMIGDGVNDAPALAKAHVGIAMGAIGSDVAIETADIALMHDDLSKVNYLIDLSHKTMSVVRQNVSVSLLIKSSFAILAFPGIITLWLAVAIGDMGLSLAVILNALRIKVSKK